MPPPVGRTSAMRASIVRREGRSGIGSAMAYLRPPSGSSFGGRAPRRVAAASSGGSPTPRRWRPGGGAGRRGSCRRGRRTKLDSGGERRARARARRHTCCWRCFQQHDTRGRRQSRHKDGEIPFERRAIAEVGSGNVRLRELLNERDRDEKAGWLQPACWRDDQAVVPPRRRTDWRRSACRGSKDRS